MTEALGRGETVPTLVTDVALLSQVTSLVDILQVAGGESLRTVRAGELLLVVVFGRDVLQQGLLSFEVFTAVWAGKCSRLKM